MCRWQNHRMDCQQGQGFAWQIEYHADADRAMCLPVLEDDVTADLSGYLVIHATRTDEDGGYIGVAMSKTPQYDVYAKESFYLNHQRNPNRAQGDGDDADGA